MTVSLGVLETISGGAIAAALLLLVIGLLALWQGVAAYRGPLPRFVLSYRGWSCPQLAMLPGGVSLICMSVFAVQPDLSNWVGGPIAAIWFLGGILFFLGFFIWFPPLLLPPWYHRARKAVVPRHDIEAMAAFKALPVEQQRRGGGGAPKPDLTSGCDVGPGSLTCATICVCMRIMI